MQLDNVFSSSWKYKIRASLLDTCTSASVVWIWLLFVRTFVCSYVHNARFHNFFFSFFSFFCTRLESHKVRKVTKSDFRKKVPSKRMGSLGFWKKCIPFICTFILEYESTTGLQAFCKNRISEKTLILELWYKSLYSDPNTGFLTNKISYEVSNFCKSNFCIWLGISRSSKFL